MYTSKIQFWLLNPIFVLDTVNVDIFALYIFSRYSRLSNVRENTYKVKINVCAVHIFALLGFIKCPRKYIQSENNFYDATQRQGYQTRENKLPIFGNARKFIRAKISTFTCTVGQGG